MNKIKNWPPCACRVGVRRVHPADAHVHAASLTGRRAYLLESKNLRWANLSQWQERRAATVTKNVSFICPSINAHRAKKISNRFFFKTACYFEAKSNSSFQWNFSWLLTIFFSAVWRLSDWNRRMCFQNYTAKLVRIRFFKSGPLAFLQLHERDYTTTTCNQHYISSFHLCLIKTLPHTGS